MAAPLLQCTIVVSGRVQGVGYRWAMVQAAQKLGVRGWVRNRRNGTVEAQAVGEQDTIDQLIAWAREGPSTATVERVEISASSPVPAEVATETIGFEQRPTF